MTASLYHAVKHKTSLPDIYRLGTQINPRHLRAIYKKLIVAKQAGATQQTKPTRYPHVGRHSDAKIAF